MTTVNINDKFYDEIFNTEVSVIHVSPQGQILVKYDDESLTLFDNYGELNYFGYRKIDTTDGWVTIVRDKEAHWTYPLDVIHVTKENAQRDFDKLNDGSLELLGFKYFSWSSLDE